MKFSNSKAAITEHPDKSFLPEGAKGPLNLNKEIMNMYKDAMMRQAYGK
jgi:hypothetical protein